MKHLPLEKIKITSPYGMRMHPIERKMKLHNGVDLSATMNTPVYAVDDGKVVISRWVDGAGEVMCIKHNGYHSYYCHLSKRLFMAGATVKAGSKIALSGNTGNSTGPHLHFGLCKAFNVSNFSLSSWYDPADSLEELDMETKPLVILDKRTGKKITIEDNYLIAEKNHPGLRELLEALGFEVGYDNVNKMVTVK